MRTVTFKRILEGVARRMGIDPVGVSFTTELAGHIGEFANDRIKRLYECQFWPEMMRIEQRPLRADWDVTAMYGLGDQVIGSDDIYYVSEAESNVANDPTTDDGTWWVMVGDGDEFDRVMALDLDGYSVMGQIEYASTVDPRSASSDSLPNKIGFWLGENGVQFGDDVPARVWMRFQIPPPKLTGIAWSATTTYAAGDQVYLGSTGQCYVALGASTHVSPDGNPAEWELQEIPALFEEVLKVGTVVDMLSADGQMEKALAMDSRFSQLLLELQEKTFDMQDQQHGVEFRGYW
jgi:hypothetical protein